MKKCIITFVAGLVTASTIAFAASYVADPADFKVMVNGKEFTSDPPALVVNGSTYLPLRAMGDALGVPVNWNSDLYQAEVGSIPAETAATNAGEFNSQNVISQLKTTTYTRQTEYYKYVDLVVKNTSQQNIRLNVNLKLKDASGALVGAKSEDIYAMAPNQEVCVTFSNEEAFDSFEYSYGVEEIKANIPQIDKVSIKVSKTDSKAIIEAKNNSNNDVDTVEVTALFFKDGKCVYSQSRYPEKGTGLKVGEEGVAEISCDEEFDDVKIYTEAYNYGW